MRKFFQLALLLAALGWSVEPCQAQTLEDRIRNIYASLDKSQVQSGILIHQTPLFIWPGRYDGINTADSMRLNLDQFGILYGQFRGASVGKSFLPEPSAYLDKARSQSPAGDTVSLAFMAVRYDFIRAEARDANLLQWHNGQMRDVPRRVGSPYGQDTCFAFTSLRPKVQGLKAVFALPSELIFSNIKWRSSTIEVDFGDGQGFQPLTQSGLKEINYNKAGQKTLTLRCTIGRGVFMAATVIEVEETPSKGSAERNGAVPYDEDDPEIVNLGGATLSIFSACEDKKVRRPLIVVEGFGGYHTSADMFLLLSIPINGELLRDWMNDREYDLIWVDLNAPFASISLNAIYLAGAIDWINNRKHADGSSEPNALIGASMGGLVSKLALLQMHNTQDKDSEVERFFTYDSPLKGANFPIGIQTFIRDLVYNASNIGASTASLQGALDLLDSPAAKDMLVARVLQGPPGCTGCPITFTAAPSAQFTALQNSISTLESIRPLSAITRHIALSNGANLGILQESMTPIMQILKLHIELQEIEGAGAWQGCYDVIIDAKSYAATNVSTLVYERSITVDISLLCDPFANNSTDAVSFTLPAPMNLDNAPGATSELGLQLLEDGLGTLIASLEHVEDSEHDVMINSFSFVPTVSSLDMPLGANPNTPTPNGGASVNRWTASNNNSVVSPFSNLPEFNQEHVSMNSRIATVIVDELEPVSVTALDGDLTNGEIYNFGRSIPASNTTGVTETPRNISQDLTIANSAQLWINRDDRIGYTNNSGNPLNRKPQQFTVSVPGASCLEDNQVTVTVENGGKIKIGEYDGNVFNIGQLHFGKNSELIVNGPEAVLIDKESTLAIEGGATMTIRPGAKVLAADLAHMAVQNGSELTIQPGGTLEFTWGADCVVRQNSRIIVEAGGILQISHPNTNVTVQSGGELILRPGAILRLWDGQQDDGEAFLKIEGGGKLRIEGEYDLSGNGYIWLQGFPTPGYPVYEDLRSEIHYKGHSKTCRLFFLDRAGFSAVNKPLRLERLQIDCNGVGGIGAENSAIRIFDVNFESKGAGLSALWVWGGTFMLVRNTDFIEFPIGLEISEHQGLAGVLPRIENSRFTKCQNGLMMYNSRYLNIINSHFTDCIYSSMELYNVTNSVNFNNSTITGTGAFSDIYGTDVDLLSQEWPVPGILLQDVPRFRMSGGSIQNCQTGIFVPDFARSNIVLTNKATIQGNQIGIHVRNGFRDVNGSTVQNYGMVLMDCAKLLDNHFGIMGSNVLLQINAFANSGTKDPAFVRSNHFRLQPISNYFRSLFYLCYDATGYNISSISAPGNFWEGVDNQPITPWRLYNSALDFGPPIGCYIASNPNNVTLLRDPVAPAELAVCPVQISTPNPNGDEEFACAPPDASEIEGKLHEQFYNGYRQFSIEADSTNDFTLSDAIFQPLSDISQQEIMTMTEKCRSFVYGSQAFVKGNEGGERNGNNEQYHLSAYQADVLRVLPNPSSNTVTIWLPDEDCFLRVWDTYGKLVFETQTSAGTANLDVSHWPVGVYWAEAAGAEFREKVKLVVQR